MTATLVNQKIEEKIYTDEELSQLRRLPIPEHVAIIMDGNRRWAQKQGLPPIAGHWRGADNLYHIVKCCGEIGIKVLTVYAFSTENWKRSPLEIKALMRIFKAQLTRQKPVMQQEGIRLSAIGDVTKFPLDVQKSLNETIEATKEGETLELVIALNYGGRDEIRRAIQTIIDDVQKEKIKSSHLTEEMISSYLDTARWKDPDLLIRPSGESRLSNFLLWQISYTEVLLTNTLWPDFNGKHLLNAIFEYQKRELRLGK